MTNGLHIAPRVEPLPGVVADRLLALMRYDRENGVFYWTVTRGKARPGSRAGSPTKDGYLLIRFDGHGVYVHRLVWFVETGAWPISQIDHRDCDKQNNRFPNLREVNTVTNMQNIRKPTKRNKTGFLGVYPRRGRFASQIKLPSGKKLVLGDFDTPEQAHAAYVAAKREYHSGSTL